MRSLYFFLALALGATQARAAACNTASRLNGFDNPAACTGVAEVTLLSSSQSISAVAAGALTGFGANYEGSQYGLVNSGASAIAIVGVTFTAANFPAAIGTDFSSYQFISIAWAATRTSMSAFIPDVIFTNGATNYVFTGLQATTRTSVAASTDWTNVILSLNYARNLGLPVSSIASVTNRWHAAISQPFTLGLDDAAVVMTGGNTPNNPLTGTDLAGTAQCTAYNITLTPQAQSGTDAISGYHIYRSTMGSGGPYVSYKYVNAAPWAFTVTGPFSNTTFFKVLPYSGTTTSFNGGSAGNFVKASNTTLDPVNSQIAANGGVFEADLSGATAIGPFNELAACPPTPTPTFTPTPTITQTSTVTPTSSPTGTFTPTPTDTPTATPTFTATPTATPTQTPGPTGTNTPPPTPGPSFTNTPVNTVTNTPVPPPPTGTFTVTPTFTITMTHTITPTPSDTPVGPDAQLYPNPFNPDKELFYLGNVKAGAQMNIYNLIGEKVYNLRLQGDPNKDNWDGLNNNGVKVVTGIYFVVIDGMVYRLAVVRN